VLATHSLVVSHTGFAERAKLWIYRRNRELRKQEQRIKDEEKRKAEADAKNALKVCPLPRSYHHTRPATL
jgi:hypothetical protein